MPALRTAAALLCRAAFVLVAAVLPAAAQVPAAIRIETAPGGNAALVATQSRAAGDSLRVFAAAYDSAGLYTGPASVNWTLSSAVASIAPDSGTTALVSTSTAGTFTVHADAGSGVTASSEAIHVVPGPAAQLALYTVPGAGGTAVTTLTLSADSTLVLYAGSFDAYGNWTGALAVDWSCDGKLARLAPAHAPLTVVDAATAGTGFLRAQAAGIPTVAVPLTITPGRAASLRISLGTNAPAFGDTLVTVGSTFTLRAQAFDAEANRIVPDPSAGWTANGSGLLLLPVNGPQVLVTAASPGSGRVVATLGALQATTGVIRTTVGALARLRISQAPDAIVAPGSQPVSADGSLPLFVLGLDAAGNLLGAVSAAWTSSDAAVARPLTTQGVSSVIDFARAGTAMLRADAPGATADSLAFNVVPGALARLQIEDQPDGSGAEIGARTVSADSILRFHAIGRDADGNLIGPRPAVWSLTSPVGTLTPGSASTCVLDPARPGSAYLTAFDGPRMALAGLLTVTAGAPYAVRILDVLGTPLVPRALFPGESLTAVAGLLDRDGNPLGTAPVAWSWVGQNLAPVPATETPSFTWQAAQAGEARLRAAAAGVQPDTSAVLRVSSGAPAALVLRNAAGQIPTPGALTADATLDLFAFALDAGGNELGQVPVSWSVVGASGLADVAPPQGSATLLRPHHPGDVRVQALHTSGLQAEAGPFTIVPGAAVRVRIESAPDGSGAEVGPMAFGAGATFTLFAVGRDAQGNAAGPLAANWFVSGGIGALAPAAGTSTVFTAEHPGAGVIRVTAPLLDGDTTGTFDVQPGTGVALFVESTAGDPFDVIPAAQWTADDSLLAFAVLRDAFGNFVADVPAAWSWVGTPGAVSVAAAVPQNSTRLTVLHPGSGRLQAAWNGLAAQTGAFDLVPGAAAALAVESSADGTGTAVAELALVAGDAVALHAVVRDARGNFAGALPAAWNIVGSGAALDLTWGPRVQLSATAPGILRVTAAAAGLNVASTGNFTIGAGAPVVMRLERTPGDPFDLLGAAALTAGDSLTAFAVLRDAFGNWVADAPAQWSVLGTPGAATLAASGAAVGNTLRAWHPGSVSLLASWGSFVVQSPPATIGAGALAQMRIETTADGTGFTVGDRALGAGSSVALHAVGRDAYGNYLGNIAAGWSLEGAAGVLDAAWGQSVRFTANRPGTSRVIALHSTVPQAVSGIFTVSAGTPAALFIERTAGDPADPIGASVLAAGDSLPAFAVWRDSLGNVVAGAPADWSVEGTAGAAQVTLTQGLATVLRALHPGRVWLRATGSGSENIIGPVDIRPGAAAGTIELAVRPDTLRADLVTQAALAGGPVTDAWGNALPDGTRIDLQLSGVAALAGQDLDAATPGVQRSLLAGRFTLDLVAPALPGTAAILASAGAAQGQTAIAVLPVAAPAVVAGSLAPGDWLRGTPFAAAIDILHTDPVALRIEQAVLRLDDGNGSWLETTLTAPVTALPGTAARLQFAAVDAPAAFRAGAFAPTLHLQGHDTIGHAFARDLAVGASSLHLFDGAIAQVTGRTPDRLTRGNSVRFAVEVAGSGDATVTLDPAQCRLLGAPATVALDPTSPSEIVPGAITTLWFQNLVWPADGAVGDIPLQLELRGTQPGGTFAALLDVPAVRIEAAATLLHVAGSLSPALAPVGAAPAPRVVLRNTGGSALRLDARTTVSIAGRSAALVQPLVIAPDSVGALEFAALDLTGTGPGRWPVDVRARGVQNGADFEQVLMLADSLTLFAPNALTIVGIQPSQASVTARQTQPWSLRLGLWNAGAVAYQIDSATLRVVLGGIDRTADYTLVRHKPLATFLAPASRDTLEFVASRTGADAGLATLEAVVQATDLVSGQTVVANTFNAGKGSLRVQLPGNPVAGTPVLSQPTVVENQTNPVEMTLEVRNAGEASLLLDAATLTGAIVTVPTVPVQVRIVAGTPAPAAGESVTLAYTLGPFAIAPGALQVSVSPAFIENNRGVTLAAAASAGLTVVAAAQAAFTSGSAPARVTQAQTTPFSIRFDVVNSGGAAVRLESPHLDWIAAGPAPVFTVRNPTTFEDGGALVLAPGARRTLRFDIDASDAVARTVQAQPVVTLREDWSGRTAEVRGPATVSLRVEAAPAVALVAASLTPPAAAIGQLGEITIQVRNTGEAQLALVPARSWARVVGGTVTHTLAATASLAGGSTGLLRFAAAAFDGVPGDASVEFHLEGVHNGNAWSADLGPAPGLRLERASSLEITAVVPGVARATRGQSRAWQVRARVQNHGGAATLESARLAFALGTADISSGFAFTAPTAFESGSVLLAAGSTDSLLFDVTQTADVTGLVVVDASVEARDLNTGASVAVTGIGTARGSVRLDGPAAPVLQPLVLSQSRVSAGQRGTWRVQGAVKNMGESPWTPDWAQITFALGAVADDSIAAHVPGAVRALDAGESDGFEFEVLRTGAETGLVAALVQLGGVQNSDGTRIAAAPHPALQVRAQTPPAVRVDSLAARTVRPARANTGQTVTVDVALTNTGEATVQTLSVALHADGAVPADTLLTASLAGATPVLFQPRFRLRPDAGPVVFTLTPGNAQDANDSTQTQAWLQAGPAVATLAAETPGALQVAVVPSQARVSAGQAREWWMSVRVINSGDEPLVLQTPRASDIEMQRAGIPQNDYIVVPPTAFDSGGLTLDGGGEGTLRYRVTRTGEAGGTISLHATALALHTNEPARAPASGNGAGTIEVDAVPGLRILSTESRTYRRDRGFDDFRVDAGQAFRVLVTVENTGGTVLDSIVVDLASQRGNSQIDGPQRLASLQPGERAEVQVPVVAGNWLSQPGLPESFGASVRPARDHNSGLTVLPAAAVDATTFAYVESPAQLALTAGIESPEGAQDGVLAAGQTFVFGVRLHNEGGAEVADNARAAVALPPGFDILDGDPESFLALDVPLRWTIRAPQTEQAPGDSIRVFLSAVPADANSGAPAAVRIGRFASPVEVHAAGALQAELFAATASAALRGVVSTGQSLDLGIVVRGDADLVDRSAELDLPGGWSLATGTPPKINLPPGVEARASTAVTVGSAPGRSRIVLRTAARNRNDDSVQAGRDTLELDVQRAARLTLDARIVSPAEARDGRVLPGQQFQVRAWVRNQGEAGVAAAPDQATHGTLRMVDVPAGWTVENAEQGFDLHRAETTLDWNVTAPPVVRPDAGALRIVFGRVPLDANSAMAVSVDPDSSTARCVVSLANDAVRVEVTPLALPLAAPGQKGIALLQVVLRNQAEAPVRFAALGVESFLDGVVSAGVFEAFELAPGGGTGVPLRTAAAPGGVTWIDAAAAGDAGLLAPGASAVWVLRGDASPRAAGHTLTVAVRDHGTGAALVRLVEAGSSAAVPVTADAGLPLASNALRVLEAVVSGYNAPNPFHAGREVTQLFYRVDGDADVAIRIFTLQGDLVWETRHHEAAAGAALRSAAWDGRNGAGQWVRNGVYVCSIQAGARASRFKIAVVR